jgi:Spy/CpxP family protein refolding chaperone
MFLAIGVGIFTTVLMFVTVTPGIWAKMVMGALGASVVLFSVRALAKKKNGLYLLIAVLMTFSDVSLYLSLTAEQSHQVASENDPELKRLQRATDEARGDLSELIAQQDEANSRATLDALALQIAEARSDLRAAKDAEANYNPNHETAVNASELFMAIPTAITSGSLGRWMTLVFASLVAIILQLTIVATVTATVRSVKRGEATAKPKSKGKTKTKKVTTTDPPATEAEIDQFVSDAFRLGQDGIVAHPSVVARETGMSATRAKILFTKALDAGKIKPREQKEGTA